MKLFLVTFLFSFVALASPLALGSPSDEAVVKSIIAQAASAPTFGDFAARAFSSPELRDESAAYLASIGLVSGRMISMRSEKNVFIVDTFGGEVRAQYEAKPRALARIFTRVIYLDRPVKMIATDLGEAFRARIFGGASAAWTAFLPRAEADEDYNRAVAALATGLKAAQARSEVAGESEQVAERTSLEEVQTNVCEVGYKFECRDKKTDGRDYRVNVEMPGGGFFSRYRFEDFKKDAAGGAPASLTTDTYRMKKYWSDWDTSPCVYTIVAGKVTKSSPPSCGQGALTQMRVQNKSATKADAVVPQIALAALLRCCSEDSQCHRKIKDCVNRDAKADRSQPSPHQSPIVH